jgi:hypothetical protein
VQPDRAKLIAEIRLTRVSFRRQLVTEESLFLLELPLVYPEIWHRDSDLASLGEGVSAGTRARGVGVIDCETLLLDGVLKVNLSAIEIRDAHLIHDNFDAIETNDCVCFLQSFVKK